ncbi:MAG: T3SS effector HopA1 family protein, partial [Bacteroidota bacterium]|nr:T3SS effector HopA1 family protein [Bacteroidota bacterium]
SHYNTSLERFDAGWCVDQIDSQGIITATKCNYTKNVYAGEFLNDSIFSHAPAVNHQIRLLVRKEHKDPEAGFYYAFGNTVAEDNTDQLVRVYFNISAAGIMQLVKSVTEILNMYSLPFSFKCVNHPFFYTRCDVAVLYLEKRYSNMVFFLLGEIHEAVRQYLLADIPLFTKQLAKGIAFAENPLKIDESFGTHISKMITQGIMNAINKNAGKQFWVQEIKMNIEQHHQYADLETLYLNPNSKYPYAFPKFN